MTKKVQVLNFKEQVIVDFLKDNKLNFGHIIDAVIKYENINEVDNKKTIETFKNDIAKKYLEFKKKLK